ncbi:MAG: gliding motility-associated protein GldE [Flavipsychrobacter sp.]|nr:gliding motility-associated protein GldE [Flavipsychrobacter sp.]
MTSQFPLLLQASSAFQASNVTILIIITLVLLLVTAIIAGAETAFFSLTAKDINYLKVKEQSSARQAISLLEQPKLLLATMLVANTFINIAIIITTNRLVATIFPELDKASNMLMFFGVHVVAVTFLLVLFGEVLPKVYATQNNMRMALFAAPILKTMQGVFKPVSSMLVSSTNYIEDRLSSKSMANISSEDFEHAIEVTMGHSATKAEVNIFKGILKFNNISVTQIMRTRMDVSGLEHDLSFAQVKKHCLDTGYSRLPVYEDSLDKIKGMVYTKDFLPYIDDDNFDWHTLIRPAYFVHEGKLIKDLRHEFQQKRIHFAVVVDEFGGTSGIVTLEDIMEEIIGDIRDEFDEEDNSYKKIDEYNYIFEGKTLINDVCRAIGESADIFEEVRGGSESLAGLILEISGKFPAVNQMVNFAQFEFTVLEIDKMRIQKVKLSINPELKEEN